MAVSVSSILVRRVSIILRFRTLTKHDVLLSLSLSLRESHALQINIPRIMIPLRMLQPRRGRSVHAYDVRVGCALPQFHQPLIPTIDAIQANARMLSC